MQYPQLIHWAEGLFLQPQHFQVQQQANLKLIDAERAHYSPYKEGIFELEIDEEALRAKRLVIKRLSALMPDGLGLSFPENCKLEPIELNFEQNDKQMLAYLAVPLYKENEANLNNGNSSVLGRFVTKDKEILDDNFGDNEVVVITRVVNARLITDLKLAEGCTVLPLVKFKWSYNSENASILEIDDEYTPPTSLLDVKSNLFNLVDNFIYELGSIKSKLIADIDAQGFDENLIGASSVLKIILLQNLNVVIERLRNNLLPGRVSPFTLFGILSDFLAQVRGLNPIHNHENMPVYEHYNLYPVFVKILKELRDLLKSNGKSECIELDFTHSEANEYQYVTLSEDNLNQGKEFYIALRGNSNWKERIADIEDGDNFRLLDKESQESRIRGIKLSYMRFPPRYLPIESSDTVYFKVMREESPRIWKYIVEDKQMVIDYAKSIFPDVIAKLYIAIVDA